MVLLVDLTSKFLKKISHFSPFFQDELFYLQLMHILSIFILLTYWIFFKKQILKNLFTIEHWKHCKIAHEKTHFIKLKVPNGSHIPF